MNERPYALMSVHDKTGLGPLATLLVRCGYGLLSSSGTARFLREQGLEDVVKSAGDEEAA